MPVPRALVASIVVMLTACAAPPAISPNQSASTVHSASPSAEPSPSLPAGCINPPVDISTLIDATQAERADPVACYGDAELTFDATWMGGGVADCPAAPEPAWLACSSFSLQMPGDTRKVGAPQLIVAVHPSAGVSIDDPYAQVRVSGHFDDPAAQTCHETGSLPDASPAPDAEVITRCRNSFVITDVVGP